MKIAVLLATLAIVGAQLDSTANTNGPFKKAREYYEKKFFDWMAQYNIKPLSGNHFVSMLKNWAANDDLIEEHNAKGLSYTLGHNQYSHLSFEEFKQVINLGGFQKPAVVTPAPFFHETPSNVSALPDSLDWVSKGAVTDVKDQGQCGSCWSFSTTGALEGAYQIKYGKLESFSEQNLVDCDNRKNGGKDMGCNGGLMDNAFDWTAKNGGLCTEAAYPYTSGKTKTAGTCTTTCSKVANVAPKSHVDVDATDAALMSALNVGPVSVAIEADQSAFQLYKSGVFTGTCGTKLDHGVLAVGYGTLNGVDYWKVKNSWGMSWGDDGYILLQKGGSGIPKEGQCGILSGPPSYPIL